MLARLTRCFAPRRNLGLARTPTRAVSTMHDDKKLQEARAVLMEHAKTVLDSMQSDGWTGRMLDAQSDFARPAYEFMWSGAYDGIWARPGLERKYRSLAVISMLAATGKLPELRPHVRMGLVNGLAEEEIRECLIHVMGYCGYPAGMEAFGVADEVIATWKKEHAGSSSQGE